MPGTNSVPDICFSLCGMINNFFFPPESKETLFPLQILIVWKVIWVWGVFGWLVDESISIIIILSFFFSFHMMEVLVARQEQTHTGWCKETK